MNGLKAFAREIIQRSAFEGQDLDGGEIQDLAVKHGLLKEVEFDPEKHYDEERDYDENSIIMEGEPWFLFSGPLRTWRLTAWVSDWRRWNNSIFMRGKPFQKCVDCGKRNILSAHRGCIPF